MQLQENTLFANRYQLERLLGRGGFSEVWLAKDNWTHLKIALKVYAPGQGMDANGLQEFCGELANVFDLNHTNLLKPTHVDAYGEMPYLIMAYCSQGSLAGKLGKMTEDEIWHMIHDVSAGLAYLHERDVVHQDIKPDNILIDEFNNYVITDFGISTRARSTLRKSVVGGTVSGGTTAYMAPERFSRQPAPTKASDIWSFGAMVYEVIEGEVPFGEVGGGLQKGGAEIPLITKNVSDALKYTVYKMLSKETWDRPFAKDLVKWAENPSAIAIDYDLLTAEEKAAEQPRTGRETQRFDAAPEPPVAQQPVTPEPAAAYVAPPAPKKKKSMAWLWVLLALFFIGGVGGACGLFIYHQAQVNKRIEALSAEHYETCQQFNSYLREAGLENIEAYQNAKTCLLRLDEIEADKYYEGTMHVAGDKRQALKVNLREVYREVERRYQMAPEGSGAKTRNLEKLNQLGEIINDL